jgi:uncharacterized protein (TIGR02118 family)
MVRVHIWLRKKESMSSDEFREYWVHRHAPIARDGYAHLRGYTIDVVTRVPEGEAAPYDGIATLSWDDREGFRADMASEAGTRGTKDLENFTGGFGLLFVDGAIVK